MGNDFFNTIENKLLEYNRNRQLQELINRYNTYTILDILGVGRSETSHSAMLRWLLEGIDLNTNERNTPLMRFLDILVRRNRQQYNNNINKNLNNLILSRKIRLSDITVEAEKTIQSIDLKFGRHPLLAECTDRIDIFVTANIDNFENKKLIIIIENKIKSSENPPKTDKKKLPLCYIDSDQTKRYYLATNQNCFIQEEARKR